MSNINFIYLFETLSTCDSHLFTETCWKKTENFQAASSHRRHQNKKDYPWTIRTESNRKITQQRSAEKGKKNSYFTTCFKLCIQN